jgi:hypothetical protein
LIETFQLYGGDVLLEYNPENKQQRYHVVIKGRRYKVPGVTTALESLAKPALIPWAVNCAINFVRPAIAPGIEHAESYLEEVYAQAKKEATRIKRAAADVGTEAHRIIESNESFEPGTLVGNCVSAARQWLGSKEIHWLYRERPIYSRRYRFSGRFDGLALVDGVLSLIDWKSSKGIYAEYRFQTAAYVHAYEEEFPESRIEQRILIRLGKEDGAFDPRIYPRKSLRKDFSAFLGILKAHTRLKEIEKEDK